MAIDITIPELVLDSVGIEELGYKSRFSGVYFLQGHGGELLYIGKSVDVVSRVKQHVSKSKSNPMRHLSDNFIRVSAFIAECAVERDIYETFSINKHKPPYNIEKCFTYNSSRPISDDEIKAQEEMQKRIAKSLEGFKL